MGSRALLPKLVLLTFFLVFLIWPLVYVLPQAFFEWEYQVRLLSLGADAESRARVAAVLARTLPDQGVMQLDLPHVVQSFPGARRVQAEQLAAQIQKAGGQAEVQAHPIFTTFYFQQALGFSLASQPEFPFFRLIPNAPMLWECMRNSLAVALCTTLLTTVVCLPLAYCLSRFEVPGRNWLTTLLLIPLITPPFVGAIGLERLFNRFGAVNLALMQLGLLDPGKPIDWLGQGGFVGVVIVQVVHLLPILYLNLAAAWANVDPALEDAARNLGAGEARVFRTVTFPLLVPGYFAGASLVFIWSFTDLGTPLVFNWNQVVPVQIYDQVSDPQRTNAVAYALVVVTLLLTGLLFYAARWVAGRYAAVGTGKGTMAQARPPAGPTRTLLVYAGVLTITLLALLPDIGVAFTALAGKWTFAALPEEYTTRHLQEVWSNRISVISIRNSVLYSAASTVLDLVLGILLAWLVVRRPSGLTGLLDGLAMVPLALPGLVLAFGYLTCYSSWNLGGLAAYLDPTRNPVLLLILAYTVRRLPYLTRSAQAGLQQIPPTLEEAAENLGARRLRVFRTVTMPLIAANLVAGAILTFSFAVLEVSDSLMLAREERFFPITRAILGLLMRPDDGDSIASALALFAMGLLTFGLVAASFVLGRKFGELFRA
jgi:iron(III) transport system permease protein